MRTLQAAARRDLSLTCNWKDASGRRALACAPTATPAYRFCCSEALRVLRDVARLGFEGDGEPREAAGTLLPGPPVSQRATRTRTPGCMDAQMRRWRGGAAEIGVPLWPGRRCCRWWGGNARPLRGWCRERECARAPVARYVRARLGRGYTEESPGGGGRGDVWMFGCCGRVGGHARGGVEARLNGPESLAWRRPFWITRCALLHFPAFCTVDGSDSIDAPQVC